MKSIKISMIVFYDDSGKIMLNHRKDGLSSNEDVWEITGGGINEGENPEDAIKREVLEELNYQINDTIDRFAFEKMFKIESTNFQAEIHLFSAKFPGFNVFSDSNEVTIDGLKLFYAAEALNLTLLPFCRHILENHKMKYGRE